VGSYDDIEAFWDAILSEDELRVRAAWGTLDADERGDVARHLMRMADVTEGFAEGQQASARFALAAISAAAD
jgi:hypothetical protein